MPTAPKAPTGGFQNGGWYDGRQYWNGVFGAPGQIINPNQQGTGQLVSPEVNRQSDAAQGLKAGTIENYLEKQRAQNPAQIGTPTGPTAATGNGASAASFNTADMAGAGGGVGVGYTPPPAIDLNAMYKQLHETSGLGASQAELSQKEKDFTEAQAKVNDNPFLNEASRVGRQAKLRELFDNRTANLRSDIATKKADIETQLQIQLKQFDMNSQQAQQAREQLNMLLQTGALAGASGEDIANLTRSTGISSSMIRAAIQASQKKDIKTQVITNTDDNGNVTASVINTETGQIIAKNDLGAIGGTKERAGSGNSTKVTTLLPQMQQAFMTSRDSNGNPAVNSYGDVDPQVWKSLMAQWVSAGGLTEDFVKNFSSYTDLNRGDFEQAYGFKKSLITDVKQNDTIL